MVAKYIATTALPPGLQQTTHILLPAVLSRIAGIFIRRFSTFLIHLNSFVIFQLCMRTPLGVRIFCFANNFTISDTVALL